MKGIRKIRKDGVVFWGGYKMVGCISLADRVGQEVGIIEPNSCSHSTIAVACELSYGARFNILSAITDLVLLNGNGRKRPREKGDTNGI